MSQMEIQTAHWYHQQVTVHPVVAYYNCHQCQETVQEDILFISDDLTHDAHAVHKFITLTNKHMTECRGLNILHEVQYSDGCSSQHKSVTPFCDISFVLEDFGFVMEGHFYGSRHGKGPSDGAGAVLKSAARRAVMAQKCVINNSLDLHDFAREKLTKDDRQGTDDHMHYKRTMVHVSTQDITRNRPDRVAKTVKGIRSLHCVKTNSAMKIMKRNLSCFCKPCQTGQGQCENSEYVESWQEKKLCRREERRVQHRDTAGVNNRGLQGCRNCGVRIRGVLRGAR